MAPTGIAIRQYGQSLVAGAAAASWGTSESGRRARYYRLTAAGRRQLGLETRAWQRFSGAVNAMLATG